MTGRTGFNRYLRFMGWLATLALIVVLGGFAWSVIHTDSFVCVFGRWSAPNVYVLSVEEARESTIWEQTLIGVLAVVMGEFTPPESWLECDGRTLPANGYVGLHALIGREFTPAAVTEESFCLPDYRGVYCGPGWLSAGPPDGPEFLNMFAMRALPVPSDSPISLDGLKLHWFVRAR